MNYDFEDMCLAVARHIKENNGAFDLIWLEKHIAGCNHCKSIMFLINHTFLKDFRRQVGGEDVPDLEQN